MPLAPLYQAAYYALFAIGSVSVGYLCLRAGNRLPEENTAKIASCATIGAAIAITAALADYYYVANALGVEGVYPIVFLALTAIVGLLFKALAPKEKPRETLIEAKNSLAEKQLPQEKQESNELSVDEIIRQADKKREMLEPAKQPETSADKKPREQREPTEFVERVSINRGVERVESDMEKHERRMYAKKQAEQQAPPTQATRPANATTGKPFNEREELESLTKDLQEQAKKQKKESEEKKVNEQPQQREKIKPAPKELFGLNAPSKQKEEPQAPQSKSLFDELSSIDKQANAKKESENAPFEKGVCPNCSAKTSRVVFCPHCGNGMCATCTTSITPTENGFEYVCPTCGEKISVKKKS